MLVNNPSYYLHIQYYKKCMKQLLFSVSDVSLHRLPHWFWRTLCYIRLETCLNNFTWRFFLGGGGGVASWIIDRKKNCSPLKVTLVSATIKIRIMLHVLVFSLLEPTGTALASSPRLSVCHDENGQQLWHVKWQSTPRDIQNIWSRCNTNNQLFP